MRTDSVVETSGTYLAPSRAVRYGGVDERMPMSTFSSLRPSLRGALRFFTPLFVLPVVASAGCEDPPADDGQCAAVSAAPTCGSGSVSAYGILPSSADDDFDPALHDKAHRLDRQYAALSAWATGGNANLYLPAEGAPRDAVSQFVDDDGWDFEASTGVAVEDVFSSFGKTTGGYAGPALASDAFRYGLLRDAGASCDDVDQARGQLLQGLDLLHMVTAITGVPGVMARSISRVDLPGDGQQELTPLFDDDGNPLPEEKNNGTWRADNSGGRFPDYAWEDSCSRDMFIGWALAYGAAWEVIGCDPSIPDDIKARMQTDALAIAKSLMVVQEDSGRDLEIRDADGRRTYHGVLHEASIDRFYVNETINGPNAQMALGIVAALNFVAEDDSVRAYIEDELITRRFVHYVARDYTSMIDFGVGSNFSGYNMAFLGALMAFRYLENEDAREAVALGMDEAFYASPETTLSPNGQGQALYDLTVLLSRAGLRAGDRQGHALDDAPRGEVLKTLNGFPDAPTFSFARDNCDATEIESGVCVADDGETYNVRSQSGWNGDVMLDRALPISIRPSSDYYWRSNPYAPNGGNEGVLLPSPDFRFVYWLSRWARRP